MTLNSVNTNAAALVALQGLNKTNELLQGVENQVSTGYRIASAKDDGAGFAIAQGLRADKNGYDAITEQLQKAQGTMSVANDAAQQVSDALGDIRSVITKLADGNVSGTQRAQYLGDYNNLKTEVQNFINNAAFNGTNLLNSTAGVKVIDTLVGGSITLNGFDLTTSVYNTLPTITAGDTATTVAASLTATGALSNAENNIGNAMAQLGSDSSSLDTEIDYVGTLSDATDTGIGAIVDADLAKASAQLQSLQIRQQLGTQALSIANQAPNLLLNLFK